MSSDANEWLRNYLGGCKTANVNNVRSAAESAGIKRRDLKAAKAALGVVTTNDWAINHGVTENWYWTLPEQEEST